MTDYVNPPPLGFAARQRRDVRRLNFWNRWTHVAIRSSGQGCGDVDFRGQGLMNGATLGDMQ